MRKLATAAAAFSAAIFLANYILPLSWLTVIAAAAAAAAGGLALLHRKWLRPAMIALLFFAVGLLEYSAYSRLTVERAKEYAGQTMEISGTVLDYPDNYESYTRLRLRLAADGLPRFKAIVYDNKRKLTEAKPGDTVAFTAKISTADTLYGEPYDNYHVNGYFLRLSIKGDENLIKGFSFRTVPVRLHHFLCGRVDEIFPSDTRAFAKALMLGDKEEFYADDALYVSMSRAGLMHVVAVSGLHISFLVGLLVFLLGNGSLTALIGIVLIWCFVLVTGCSNSALRAAVMQTLLLLAPVLRRENDPVTSLSTALALLLAVCPLAARSVSLQLSFAAMAGLLSFGQRLYGWLMRPVPEKLNCRAVRYVLGVIASSLSVMPFTVPLTALHFGYVPLLGILSNIACLWAVSHCFCFAWAACLLSVIPMLGKAAAWLCAWIVRYILLVSGVIAHSPYAVLYLGTGGALAWMLMSYVMLFAGFLLRRKGALRILLPAGLSLTMLVGIILYTEHFYVSNNCVSVLDVGQGQCITAFAGENTVVIDCGNINTLDNAGTIAGEYLIGCGRRSIDCLILTHLHADHADGAVRLMEMLPVETLILPADGEEEQNLRDSILDCAARHRTKVELIESNTQACFGRLLAQIYKLADDGDLNERCLMIDLAVGDRHLLVTADAPKVLERTLADQAELEDTDILVVGHHGSKKASAEELLREIGGGTAVISVGYNNYGHPASETLDALEAYGYQVKRTDMDGTVEIRLEKEYG